MLANLIIAVAANPGPFVEPNQTAGESAPVHAALIALIPLTGLLVIAVLLWYLVHSSYVKFQRATLIAIGVLAVLIAANIVGLSVAYNAEVRGIAAATAQAEADYRESVITFLSEDYGITVGGKAAGELIAGHSVTVLHEGVDTLVEVDVDGSDKMVVYLPDRRTLAPVQ
ncbi:hypothetical protein E3T26_05395 [Cryobacterium sp. TMT1-21]|uniref:Uncharacterized protein n=1 Tax=Cryobacterium shii TaxID=1259235 RepID=A0AAQ2C857_9MICO|nr:MULTISPECIES: hypothetical protein [Cryobacterium]TFC51693.1 hypothetical protein E3O49_03400 [Cryobacterium shii]TFC89439.1 hypothetical protein E3T24_01135 [Cryobacterium sp. TmT2-59]TFD13660.1 hypothetical protein E3T42_13410 [Cryobacterium sp. TMT4-10]TFD15977.1 hypothetical protein E3T26_05395 [Cryobacterium sp. TMT1-21]TFD27068.1 hypothetical protein E3T32_02060 [Cryobacterium sp. TMT2-23]